MSELQESQIRIQELEKENLLLKEEAKWYSDRVKMLQQEQHRMRDPERTIVCDIIANGRLLPDPTRYGRLSG